MQSDFLPMKTVSHKKSRNREKIFVLKLSMVVALNEATILVYNSWV